MEAPGEKLLIKLWETLAEKGVGSLLRPWQIKREGRAMAEVRRMDLLSLAQAENESKRIRAGRALLTSAGALEKIENEDGGVVKLKLSVPDAHREACNLIDSVANIAMSNAAAESIRREVNIAKSVLHAEDELKHHNESPVDSKIDDDWLYRWRDCAANTSSDELQQLWGKALAGEVKSPGKYSLRTLEFLRNLSQSEAKLIELVSPLVVGQGVIVKCDGKFPDEANVSFSNLLELQDIGILSGVDGLGLQWTWKTIVKGSFKVFMRCNEKALIITGSDESKVLTCSGCKITSLGRQVLSLGLFKANESYIKIIGASFKKQGFEVKYGDYIPVSEDYGHVANMTPL